MAQKSILITGGANGLGLALAMEAAQRGYQVAIADINRKRGNDALVKIQSLTDAVFLYCDVQSEQSVRNAVKETQQRFGSLDVMVNNAGVAGAGPFEAIPEADWQWITDINLMGVVRGCRAAVPVMKKQGHGQIINISSMAALLPPPGMSHYNVVKAGVSALSETLRAELACWNIGVTQVCPSFFKTGLTENFRTPDSKTEQRFHALLDSGLLSAEDIARGTLDASERNQFLYLPHKQARKDLRMKKWFPGKYMKFMEKLGAKMARR